MSCVNASVHDLHHCTKLQLCTRCSFGVMTQTTGLMAASLLALVRGIAISMQAVIAAVVW